MIKLGVNVDHVATLREARKTVEPDPVFAAVICELAGADGITVHLREDKRHIQERDVLLIKEIKRTKLNLEMSVNEKIVDSALNIKPDQATLVPERREEVTTEGGLEIAGNLLKIKKTVKLLKSKKIIVSFFIGPDLKQVDASKEAGADAVEINTGTYANALTAKDTENELKKIRAASAYAHNKGLVVNAGHGLNYKNITNILKVNFVEELNIGHAIISRAVFVGLNQAVREMKEIIAQND